MERKAALLTYLRASINRKADPLIAWGGAEGQPIVEDELEANSGQGSDEVKYFSVALHARHVSCTRACPLSLANNCPGRTGTLAVGVLVRRFEPSTLGATIVQAILLHPPSKRAGLKERNLPDIAELMKRHQVSAGTILDE